MDQLRVIVADDSALARDLLREILEGDGSIRVVGQAKNGREAVELVRKHRPDLVTMDLEMPVMDGMAAIEQIMAVAAVPILVVSGASDAQKAFDAVSRGALEAIAKPDTSTKSRAEFVAKVKMLAGVRVITHIRPLLSLIGLGLESAPPVPKQLPVSAPTVSAATVALPLGALRGRSSRLFAIAASTGGPQVLSTILTALPADFPCPVVIAQHIAEGFAEGLANWLASLSRIKVRLAAQDDLLMPGVVYIAPSETHLTVTAGLRLTMAARGVRDIYRPSCDLLLTSVAEAAGADAVGIILSGMGSDGARGIEKIKSVGGVTIAQDQESSAVFGMNRVAIERGAVQRVLSADRIAEKLIALAGMSGLEARP